MGTYYIWTVGCQMNVADSERLAAHLEAQGHRPTSSPDQADVLVVNSCVVRQHAEDRVTNKIHALRPRAKGRQQQQVLALMGCLVGPRTDELERRFPQVDVFMRPQDYLPLLDVTQNLAEREGCTPDAFSLPVTGPTAFVSIIHGCDNFCTFCIVPYRRGRELSRPLPEIVEEVETLVARGVREVTLLGQKVDSYGKDIAGGPDLADLLVAVNDVRGLERIRFLTSYPLGVTDKLIEAVAGLDKVCEHINIPVQAGDDTILATMHRGYTIGQYRDRILRIKDGIPGGSLSTDVIVGFCDETEAQFQRTLDIMEEMRFDVVHVAAYSERAGTIATRTMEDSIPLEVKRERLHRVEELQETIARDINAGLLGQETTVLVEQRKDDRWGGRTRTNKLVHFPATATDMVGALATVRIVATSPWSLQGELIAVD